MEEKLPTMTLMQESISIWFKVEFDMGCILRIAKAYMMRHTNIDTLCTKATLDTRMGIATNTTLRAQATSSHRTHVLEYIDVRNPNNWL